MTRSNCFKSFTAVLIGMCTGVSNPAFSQDTTNATIDSLIVLLMNDAEDPARVDVYTALSDEYLLLDHTKSFEYSQLGLDLAERIDYERGVLESQLALAHLNMAYSLDYEEAKKFYEAALVHAQTLKDAEAELKIYRGFSNLYGAMEDYERAKSYNEKAMQIAVALDHYPSISDLNSYMGGLYESTGDTNRAIEYYKDVLAIEKKNDFSETANSSMMAVARYYYLTDDYEQALKYYRIALRNFERSNDFRWESYTHSEMARLHIKIGDLARAEQHGFRGLEIAETNKLKKELGDNYLALNLVYTEMDSSKKAGEYMDLYDSLQGSVDPVEPVVETPQEVEEKQAAVDQEEMNPFLQAILLILPVIVLNLLVGMPAKKK